VGGGLIWTITGEAPEYACVLERKIIIASTIPRGMYVVRNLIGRFLLRGEWVNFSDKYRSVQCSTSLLATGRLLVGDGVGGASVTAGRDAPTNR
jgi:hypothetical protein